jgi:hypothetical protein
MIPNPFIELARDPVAFFGLLGYALATTMFALGGVSWAIRQGSICVTLADRNHRQKQWWGDTLDGWFPPPSWQLRVASVLLALTLSSWAIGGLLWFAGGGV